MQYVVLTNNLTSMFLFLQPPKFFLLDLYEVLNLRKEYSPKQCNTVPEKINLKMLRFEFEEILDAPHLKTVSWNTNKVNLKYGICITQTSFYSYHFNVRKEKFARELHRLPTVKSMKSQSSMFTSTQKSVSKGNNSKHLLCNLFCRNLKLFSNVQ